MSETINVNANNTLPNSQTLPIAPLEPFHQGFVDTGILINLTIPFKINTSRGYYLDPNGSGLFDQQLISPTNRLPLFGVLIDPFISHDLNGPFSPLIVPDPTWASNNTQLTARPYGTEHPLTRLAPSFLGYKGGLEFMITINSTALVQGELSFIRAKYAGGGTFKWKNIQLESEEPDNNQIVNLSAEKRVVKFVSYTEATEFINTMQYWLSRNSLPYRNFKPMNLFRNWLFVRANTDINTLSTNGGTIAFKIYMKPSDDFEFLFPSIPIRPDMYRRLSVIDKLIPFSMTNQLVVSQRPVTSSSANRPLRIDDTLYKSTTEVPESLDTQRIFPTGVTGFIDFRKYVPTIFPQWLAITGYSYSWATPYVKLQVNVRVAGVFVLLYEIAIDDLKYGVSILDVHFNQGLQASVAPPYFFP